MKSLTDPSLGEQYTRYNDALNTYNNALATHLEDVATRMVELFEAAEASLNDLCHVLALKQADTRLFDLVLHTWDKRHPGAARSALNDMLDGKWTFEC